MFVVFLVFNPQTLDQVARELRPYTRPGDVVLLSSGVKEGVIDATYLASEARRAASLLPDLRRGMRTSGIDNLWRCVREVPYGLYHGITYVYEPNFPNVPEFSWDFTVTVKNFQRARYICRDAGGYECWGKPTGRATVWWMQTRYGWNYGRLGAMTNLFLPQLQTYCQEGTMRDAAALVARQMDQSAPGVPWAPQITIGDSLYNAVTADKAAACSQDALQRGADGAFVQWEQDNVWGVARWLQFLGRTKA